METRCRARCSACACGDLRSPWVVGRSPPDHASSVARDRGDVFSDAARSKTCELPPVG